MLRKDLSSLDLELLELKLKLKMGPTYSGSQLQVRAVGCNIVGAVHEWRGRWTGGAAFCVYMEARNWHNCNSKGRLMLTAVVLLRHAGR